MREKHGLLKKGIECRCKALSIRERERGREGESKTNALRLHGSCLTNQIHLQSSRCQYA